MKKLFRTMCAAAVGILSCAMLAVTAYAEDYTFDVSGASESNGKWGQSFICYTALGNEEYSENFNPMWMTSDSEVIVDYTYKGEANGSPVELIWQTWGDGPVKPNPDVTKDWNKIAPYEYTDTEAKFSFSDIAASYGSDNFDTVYAICVGDTGVNLTVTGMKVTNCNITAPVQTEEAAAEAETEAQTEEETEAETEAETEEASSEEASSEEESEEASSEEASSEEETEAETEEDIDGTGFKIGMVTDVGGVNDGSFNQSAWEGLQRAGEAFGCEVKYIESKGDADYVPNIESFLDEDYDLIVCVGYMMADAVRDAAELYPDQKFAIIDDASNADLDNVTCMMFEQEQASYLVGLAAGYTTESNIVGFVTGAANETMNSFGYGYCAGVLDANPDATILQYNANNFGDASGGKTAVNTMVTKGADVVFHAAGGTGIGVIDGCKENKIWAIGVDSDQSPLAPETILTSALKRVDNACYDATKKTILGTLEGGVETYDLAAGGVDIAPTTDNLSKDVLEKIEKAKKDIIAGDLVVPKNQEEFEEKYGDVYELD